MTEDRTWFQPECGCTVPRHRRECGGLPLPRESLSDRVLVRVCRKPSRQRRCAPFCNGSYRHSANSTISGIGRGLPQRRGAQEFRSSGVQKADAIRALCEPEPRTPKGQLNGETVNPRTPNPGERRTANSKPPKLQPFFACLFSVKNGEHFAFFVWKCLSRVLMTHKTMLHAQKVVLPCRPWLHRCSCASRSQ